MNTLTRIFAIAVGSLSTNSPLSASVDSHLAMSRGIELVDSHLLQARSAGDPSNINGIHEATSSQDGSKVYLAYGTGANGVHPWPVSMYRPRDESIDFCARGGRFGAHKLNPIYQKPFYPGFIVVAYFNAGAQVVDVRNPFHPEEFAWHIPAITESTAAGCILIDGEERCRTAIQTNFVEVDDRGPIYLSDRADTGMHIVKLSGAAKMLVEGR